MIFFKPRLVTCLCLSAAAMTRAQVPADYQGKPFTDAIHKSGPPNIPGILQCALYDRGGEGVAYHHWNLAEIGTIQFPAAGLQLLTFHYGKGNNFAYFEFEPVEPPPASKP